MILSELRQTVRNFLQNLLTESQMFRSVSSYANYFVRELIPLSMPEGVNWSNFHLKPSELRLELKDFLKQVFTVVINKTQQNDTEFGNFYIYPTSTLGINYNGKKTPFNFKFENYKNLYFDLQEGLNYNAFVLFVYHDTIVELIPINSFLHNNHKILEAAAQKYLKVYKYNFQQAKSNYKIIVDNDILNMNLTLDLTDYISQRTSTTHKNKYEKNEYRAGRPITTSQYGKGIILSAKKIKNSDNKYSVIIHFPELSKTLRRDITKKFILGTTKQNVPNNSISDISQQSQQANV